VAGSEQVEGMYIKKDNYNYFERLYKSLDENKRKRFLKILLRLCSERTGEEISKINIADDEICNTKGIDPNDFITKTMIKKAYKDAKVQDS
jgi:hypothetical protein